MKRLLMLIFCSVMFAGNMWAQEGREIVVHMGDRYVINVDAMKPDKEMTLMDVLQTCPELLSTNGKRLSTYYEICVDNVVLMMDDETVLEALKASEISTIEVYLYTSVSTGGTGRFGTIDIYLKEQADGATTGKLLLEGSTRGNGKAYADVVSRTGNVTVRGYALTNLEYARGSMTSCDLFTSRQAIENVHLNIDWNISENDNLNVKLFQNFQDGKQRIQSDQEAYIMPELQRYWGGVASYTRMLNDKGASVLAECGAEYLNEDVEGFKQRDGSTYFFAETTVPCMNNHLNILAGWEIDYYNMWAVDDDRQQMMFNDLYLQLDYTKGPWVLTLGDRFRMINYWHHTYDTEDASQWNHKRTEHSYLASVGYKVGRHFVQGLFNRDYFTPLIDDIYAGYDEDMKRRVYLTDVLTNTVYNVEARYTYQRANLVVNGSVLHTWGDNNSMADEQHTGVRASATWYKGCLRLTAGADYYHAYAKGTDNDTDTHDNYFTLRLLPALQLNSGLRFSSRLLYHSRRDLLVETPAHFYVSVKVSKDLGRHCTLSADFHDLAGSPRITASQLGSYYDNRAITLGFIYRF